MNRQIKRVLLSVAALFALAVGSVSMSEQADEGQLLPDLSVELPSLSETVLDAEQTSPEALNINTASEEELAAQLKGVGVKTAAAIVEYRDTMGLFETPEEIKEVSGIGEITFELNKDTIIVE
ncbi:helix-hairpin-helix domain-containing protein [Porticoccaceae bacterium]|nr:helix-hairpin-helix domain-containing protein [Porticoccaceae bacterium]MDA8663922.1 helix-hairpin-helix domain-containing protein [Porticoccaceae bacterium]MDB2486523.1 helix-hairpin-helix domain-containing protein [Porticoccaceae bacterium]MDB2635346.1 helix-hairpin-helix domain-containing protein [Porticoccaceae bacterium]MDB2664269.1 helix-hairpin-helix domain-containing protein [Porticoccaceae bacterium]